MALDATTRLNVAEYLAWAGRPEHRHSRTQLVHGEIIEMPPAGDLHGTLCSWIASLLWMYALRRGSGRVSANDCAIRISDDTLYGADVLFFRAGRSIQQVSVGPTAELPTLAVEVMSPSNTGEDLRSKASDYLSIGIGVVWIIDPLNQSVEVHLAGHAARTLRGTESLTVEAHLPELNLTVADLFHWPQPGNIS